MRKDYVEALREVGLEGLQVRMALWMQYLQLRLEYGRAGPRPRDLLRVDPDRIEYTYFPLLHNTVGNITKENTHVLDGDWDRVPVASRDWFSIGALDESDFEGQRRLRMDRYAFHELMENLDTRNEFATLWEDIVAEFPAATDTKYDDPSYMRRYVELYDDIKSSGYKLGRELDRYAPYPEFDEVGVYIGRDGRIDCAGFGKHRIVIAQQLGLESIPVRVNVRHEQWQARRAEIVQADEPLRAAGDDSSHPDMQLLLNRLDTV